jgi:hypothetical protein
MLVTAPEDADFEWVTQWDYVLESQPRFSASDRPGKAFLPNSIGAFPKLILCLCITNTKL